LAQGMHVQGSGERRQGQRQRRFVWRSEEGEMRSKINPFNLEGEAVGLLDVRRTILALSVAGK
jgi:hypothetical protein